MKNKFKEKHGAALIMLIVVSTVVIMLFTTLMSLAYYNFLTVKSGNERDTSDDAATAGMEKTIKNIETLVKSAQLYADQRMKATGEYASYLSNPDTFSENYKSKFEEYYREFLEGKSSESQGLKTIDLSLKPVAARFQNVGSDPELYYTNKFNLYTFTDINTGATVNGYINPTDTKFLLRVEVTGKRVQNGSDVYLRKIYSEIGINPWGYDTSWQQIDPVFTISNTTIYGSQQWSNALASSGDIVVKNGPVVINGDIYVNGKFAPLPTGNNVAEGTQYGGLIVGKDGSAGNLTVYGNIYSNNYVHTMNPGSVLNVKSKTLNQSEYDNAMKSIYDRGLPQDSVPDYSEKASNYLDSLGSDRDPLGVGVSVVSSLGKSQVNSGYIDYIKDLYGIQKKFGSFVYANNLQVEKSPVETESNITVDGSAIVFDNLQIDAKGKIYVKNNFYGFKGGTSAQFKYNESSSLITNHPQGIIEIGQRLYNAGIAYVTAFSGSSDPYPTSEGISLYKNFFGYRTNLGTVDVPGVGSYNKTYNLIEYFPFRFLDFLGNTPDQQEHAIAYDYYYNSGDTISNFGLKYDKNMIIFNGDIYSISKFPTADMGFSQGILMGKNTLGEEFIGLINSDSNATYPFINSRKAGKSMKRQNFDRYIANKYSTLMEIKALKSNDGDVVTISDLIDRSVNVNTPLVYIDPTGTNSNIIVSRNDIYITTPTPGKIRIDYDGDPNDNIYDEINGLNFKGVIMSTGYNNGANFVGGKVIINTTENINIDGAIISAKDASNSNLTDTVGIEFLGSGNKTITYDKDVLLEIFQRQSPDAQKLRQILTKNRGIVQIFKKVYEQVDKNNISQPRPGLTADFKAAVDEYKLNKGLTYEQAIEEIANMYELVSNSDTEVNEKYNLSSTVISNRTNQSKNYKIYSWKLIN